MYDLTGHYKSLGYYSGELPAGFLNLFFIFLSEEQHDLIYILKELL